MSRYPDNRYAIALAGVLRAFSLGQNRQQARGFRRFEWLVYRPGRSHPHGVDRCQAPATVHHTGALNHGALWPASGHQRPIANTVRCARNAPGISMPAKPPQLPQPARQAPERHAPAVTPLRHEEPGQSLFGVAQVLVRRVGVESGDWKPRLLAWSALRCRVLPGRRTSVVMLPCTGSGCLPAAQTPARRYGSAALVAAWCAGFSKCAHTGPSSGDSQAQNSPGRWLEPSLSMPAQVGHTQAGAKMRAR